MPATMRLTSKAFADGGKIPKRYTCEDADASPPLAWSGAPAQTKSFALIVDDPDAPDPRAPKMTYVHWVVYDIPAGTTAIAEDGWSAMPSGSRTGLNDWKRPGWGGPCPPIGRHRYFFKLYALDATIGDLGKATKGDVERAMVGHVLAQAQLVGTYQKGD